MGKTGETSETRAPEPTWKKSVARDYFESICIAVVFALFVRTFVVQAFKIPSSSMEDNLLVGDHILVNKFAYAPGPHWLPDILPYRDLKHCDVLVFKYPKDPRRDFIKRVIGTGGDTIAMDHGSVYRNGEKLDEPYIFLKRPPGQRDPQPERESPRDFQPKTPIHDGEYWVMGDNRWNSEDSRFWGKVPASHVKGRALLIYWSFDVPESLKPIEVNGPSTLDERGRSLGYTLLHFFDKTRLVRIWTGDIEIHISADIAYAAHQYWQATGDEAWFIEKGAELILDTAKFWGSRAEWNAEAHRYEYNDVSGPDEYHDHVDNNAYTNRFAQWNLQTARDVLDWLKAHAPAKAAELADKLQLTAQTLARWRDVIARIYLPVEPSGLIEQFEGYFQRKEVDLAALEPRTRSAQEIFGIEGCNETQVLKQPDVLMLQYLLRDHYSDQSVRVNYDYYTPRTDHTYGSSLGPSIMTIMACDVGKPDDAYEHFIRAARADLRDVRGNAGDGIHAASAAGTWQAVVFGFGGLRIAPDGSRWAAHPRLPHHWKRLAFKFFHRGKLQEVDLRDNA